MKNFKFLILLIIFVSFSSLELFASGWINTVYKDIEVGNEPVGVYYDENVQGFHIFCYGTDTNFNGVFEPDSGDVMPSWWFLKIDLGSKDFKYTIEKKADLPFGSIQFHFRPAFVPSENKIYINLPDFVQAYSTSTFQEIAGENYPYKAQGLTYSNGYLIISQSSSKDKIDTIIVYNVEQNKEISRFPSGINLSESVIYKLNEDKFGIAALNVGPYFSEESKVLYSDFDFTDNITFSTLNIGNTGNHISAFHNKNIINDFLVSTSMFSGIICILDPENGDFMTIHTIASEWKGPSFSKVFNVQTKKNEEFSFLASVNYDKSLELNQINIYKNQNETIFDELMIDTFNISGKSEGFDVMSENGMFAIIAANTLNEDYSPAKSISVIIGIIPSGIKESDKLSTSFFPNPTNGLIKFNNVNLTDNYYIEITNTNGQVVLKKQIENEIMNLSNLYNGVYFMKISNNIETYYKKLIILK